MRLVGKLQNLLSHKVVALIANAGIQVPIVGGVLGAFDAFASDSNVVMLAEAAALIIVLIEATSGVNNKGAGLSLSIVDFVVFAPSAGSIDQVVPKFTHTCLLEVRVDLVILADHQNTVSGVGENGIARAASALIVLRVVGLIVWAALADILDDDKAWLALACPIDEYLVGSTCINSDAPLGNFVIGISFRALAADSTNAIKVRNAIT